MQDKNKEYFLKIYNSMHEPFYRFCRAITGNAEDAKDLIQDSLLAVLESIHKIEEPASLKAYTFSVASNLWKMKIRRNKFSAYFNEEEVAGMFGVKQNQEFLTDLNIVYSKILSLPQKTAETLILFHISDLSLGDIQKIQGGSLSGVKLRLKRGREKLLNMLNSPKQIKVATILLSL